MVNRPRPRAHLLTGGPAWEDRPRGGSGGGGGGPAKLTKRQKAAKKKLDAHMADLKAALARRDLRAARAARSAAWDEVNQLADNLTTVERSELWKCKLLIRGLEKARREQRSR